MEDQRAQHFSLAGFMKNFQALIQDRREGKLFAKVQLCRAIGGRGSDPELGGLPFRQADLDAARDSVGGRVESHNQRW